MERQVKGLSDEIKILTSMKGQANLKGTFVEVFERAQLLCIFSRIKGGNLCKANAACPCTGSTVAADPPDPDMRCQTRQVRPAF
jgi:hypothetical protein